MSDEREEPIRIGRDWRDHRLQALRLLRLLRYVFGRDRGMPFLRQVVFVRGLYLRPARPEGR